MEMYLGMVGAWKTLRTAEKNEEPHSRNSTESVSATPAALFVPWLSPGGLLILQCQVFKAHLAHPRGLESPSPSRQRNSFSGSQEKPCPAVVGGKLRKNLQKLPLEGEEGLGGALSA